MRFKLMLARIKAVFKRKWPSRRQLRFAWARTKVAFSFRQYTATICGGRTKRRGIITAFGETTIMAMPFNKQGSVDYCIDCIGKMTVQCAWCMGPIFIGDAVTLYAAADGRPIPKWAVVYDQKLRICVGCLRCGPDRVGFWYPNKIGRGHVVRVPLPVEIAWEQGGMLVVQDLSDPKEALNPKVLKMS